jgi:hypothetical protein
MSSLSLGKGNNDVLKAATNGQRRVTTTSYANESKLVELRSKVFDDVKSFQPNMPPLPTIRSQPGALDEMKCAFLLLGTTVHQSWVVGRHIVDWQRRDANWISAPVRLSRLVRCQDQASHWHQLSRGVRNALRPRLSWGKNVPTIAPSI